MALLGKPSRSALAGCAAGFLLTRRFSRSPRSLAAIAALLLVTLGGREARAAAPPAAAAAASPEPAVDRLLRAYHDPGRAEAIAEAGRRFVAATLSDSTRGLDDGAAADLKRLMVHSMFEHDRITHYCNRLVTLWRDGDNPEGKALWACTSGGGGDADKCALFDERYPVIGKVMANFATLYRDPRLAPVESDRSYWSAILGCPARPRPTPTTGVFKYISDLLLEFTDRQVRGLTPFEMGVKDPDQFADFERVSRHKLYQRLGAYCAADPLYEPSLLRAMECRATLLGKD